MRTAWAGSGRVAARDRRRGADGGRAGVGDGGRHRVRRARRRHRQVAAAGRVEPRRRSAETAVESRRAPDEPVAGGRVSRADAERGAEELPLALLPPPETVTLESPAERQLRGRWSAVEGARYAVDLLRDGVRDEHRSLERASSTSFRWQSLSAGTYTIRARSVNEDRLPGPWSAPSNEVVLD